MSTLATPPRRRRLLVALASVLLAGLGLVAGPARAAGDMEVGIADDAILLGDDRQEAAEVVEEWRRLGMDTVRVHARWIAIAPAPHARSRPAGFSPRDPDDLRYNWGRLDDGIRLLREAGIRPVVAITGSGPVWTSTDPSRDNPRWKPDPDDFADFSAAVVRRYRDDVDRYLVWNEPNQAGWLQPQFECRPRCRPASPHLYRELFRAAAKEVRALDPSAEVLIGTLAPRGLNPRRQNANMRPLQFVRALGCVDDRYRRIRTGPCRNARPAVASAFSYHPHPVKKRPQERSPHPDDAAVADLTALQRALDRTQRAGVLRSSSGRHLELHLTEFGYQTMPPDPFSGVMPSQQSAWLQESWFLFWRNPRVRNVMQYEWRDEPLATNDAGTSIYAGWQSGLYDAKGRPKPIRAAFPHPFHVEVRPGRALARFWGQVRPGTSHLVVLEKRTSSGRYAAVRRLQTNAFGFWTLEHPVRSRATYRFRYEVPASDRPDAPLVTRRSQTQTVRPAPSRRR